MNLGTTSTIITIFKFSVISIGIIGNLVSFVVFSRPVFRKNSISTYCRALAIFDCFTISELVISFGLIFYNEFYAQHSDAACKAYSYISSAFASIPGWILIAFSIDKVLTMKRIGANILKNKLFQVAIITAIVLVNLLLYIEIPIYLNLVTLNFYGMTYILCNMSTLPFGLFVSTMFMIEGSILPFVVMLGSSIISIRIIRHSAKNIEHGVVSNKSMTSNRTSRDFKFAISSIAFNISFIILKLPIVIMIFMENFIPSYNTNYDVLTIAHFLYYLHYSSSFFTHLVTNSIFRRELMTILRLSRPIGVEFCQHSNLGGDRRPNLPSSVSNKITPVI